MINVMSDPTLAITCINLYDLKKGDYLYDYRC